MNANDAAAKAGWGWVIVVLLLGLPSVVFALAHLAAAPFQEGGWLETVLYWAVAVTGMLGPLPTLAALVVTIVATFQSGISVPVRVALWGIVLVSALACLYWIQVPL